MAKHKIHKQKDGSVIYRGVKITPDTTTPKWKWKFINPAINEEITVDNVFEATERIDFFHEEKARHRNSPLGKMAKEKTKGVTIKLTPDEEQQIGIGLLTAGHFDWDGEAIMKAFAHALEDSNFHEFANEIREKWLKGLFKP